MIEAAARTGTMIEINASPDRRDLNEIHARAAAAAGVQILVDTDAHSVRNFGLLRYGIATARRAWLTPEQVANTRPWAELRAAAQAGGGGAPNVNTCIEEGAGDCHGGPKSSGRECRSRQTRPGWWT